MATGIVLSVDPSGVSGQVQVDETGETLPFNDPNFPKTGITPNAPTNACTFDILGQVTPKGILYYAANLQAAGAPTTKTINGPFTGDLSAPIGTVIVITSAAAIVTGNINVSGGKVVVDASAQVNGNITVDTDGIVAVKGKGTIKGGITLNTGGNLKVVNKGKIMGGIVITQAGRVMIGNNNGPGFINSPTDIDGKIRHFSITADSSINCNGQ